MMLQKLLPILSCMWLFVAMFLVAQPPGPNDQGIPVLDTDGQPLVSGALYYIKPAIPDRGGPLTLVTRKQGSSCPKYVGQVERPELKGTPVNFTSSPTVKEGGVSMIAFQAPTSCPQSPQWTLEDPQSVTGRRLIGTGSESFYGSLFKIMNYNGLYHLVWCTTPFNSEPPNCGTAGILAEDGVRLLALDGPELPFVFEKVQ